MRANKKRRKRCKERAVSVRSSIFVDRRYVLFSEKEKTTVKEWTVSVERKREKRGDVRYLFNDELAPLARCKRRSQLQSSSDASPPRSLTIPME